MAMKKKVYLEMDCLLDTRLGTAIHMSNELGYAVSKNPMYYLRENDDLQRLHPKLKGWKDHQKKNLDAVLRCSAVTRLPSFLAEMIHSFLEKNKGTPHDIDEVSLVVNVYPYVMDDEEKQELSIVLNEVFRSSIEIEIVRFNHTELTPEIIAAEYSALIMYDPTPWINYHEKALQTRCLVAIRLSCPKLGHLRKLSTKEEATFKENGMSVYEVFTFLFEPVLAVEFFPAAVVCADTPMNPLSEDLPA
jgi:hypothetical protein